MPTPPSGWLCPDINHEIILQYPSSVCWRGVRAFPGMKKMMHLFFLLLLMFSSACVGDLLSWEVDLEERPEGEVCFLRGTLFDLKKTKGGELSNIMQNGQVNSQAFQSRLASYLKKWETREFARYYRWREMLYADFFYMPFACETLESKMILQKEHSEPTGLVILYSGRVKSPVSGKIRFCGVGDDYLGVHFAGETVLESRNGGYVTGKSIEVKENECYQLNIAIANERGSIGYALLWKAEHQPAHQQPYLFRTSLRLPEKTNSSAPPLPDFEPDSPIWFSIDSWW